MRGAIETWGWECWCGIGTRSGECNNVYAWLKGDWNTQWVGWECCIYNIWTGVETSSDGEWWCFGEYIGME